jgi:hypothetical protein
LVNAIKRIIVIASVADEYDYDYTWHFRIITYDKPTLKAKKSIFF